MEESKTILIRDVSDETLEILENFKNRIGIKTNSKGVISIIKSYQNLDKDLDDYSFKVNCLKNIIKKQHKLIQSMYMIREHEKAIKDGLKPFKKYLTGYYGGEDLTDDYKEFSNE